ncbi:MAG: hypothetical protein H0X28_04420, partial [Solirubrobacterales bacterium]|nr:hypothetical protein [Solirubrobacterales bacterium]
MPGMSTTPSAMTRARALFLMLAAAVLLSIWAPSAARAAGCTDSWTAKGSGSWFTPGNWSTGKVPVASDEVCITENGPSSYTVEQNESSAVTVKALTVGGSANTQTLVVASTNVAHAVLTTTAGITNGAHGAIVLTNAESSANNVTIVGPVSNAGTVTVEPGKGGARSLQGNLTNTGTLAINVNTSFNETKAVLTNEGSINLAAGAQLIVSNEGSVTNAAGGKIAATGTGQVLIEPTSAFTEGAGTTSGTKPVVIRDAALHYSGAGASTIATHGLTSTLSGNVSAGQSITIESTSSEHSALTAASNFTSAGSITLTNSDAIPNQAALVISAGTLTNSGSIKVEAGVGGQRFLEGNITNTGTIAINATTKYDAKGAALNNQGALNLATGTQLVVSNEGSVTNGSGGSIAGTGSGNVAIEPTSAFNEGAGTTSGTKPVIIRDAALHYTGAGSSLIATHGAGSTLSGNLSAGQSLSIESINSEHSYLTAAVGFTNAGSITLTSTETTPNQAALIVSTGTLTNSGSISVEAGVGGLRFLEGSITNTGTITINQTTKYPASSALLTNEGAIKLAAGTQLIVTGAGTVTNGAGGSIVAGENAAVLIEPGSTFNEGAGTTSGTKPVIIRDAALHYTGAGSSLIATHGAGSTLSG